MKPLKNFIVLLLIAAVSVIPAFADDTIAEAEDDPILGVPVAETDADYVLDDIGYGHMGGASVMMPAIGTYRAYLGEEETDLEISVVDDEDFMLVADFIDGDEVYSVVFKLFDIADLTATNGEKLYEPIWKLYDEEGLVDGFAMFDLPSEYSEDSRLKELGIPADGAVINMLPPSFLLEEYEAEEDSPIAYGMTFEAVKIDVEATEDFFLDSTIQLYLL